jgi:hypothetical protein
MLLQSLPEKKNYSLGMEGKRCGTSNIIILLKKKVEEGEVNVWADLSCTKAHSASRRNRPVPTLAPEK